MKGISLGLMGAALAMGMSFSPSARAQTHSEPAQIVTHCGTNFCSVYLCTSGGCVYSHSFRNPHTHREA